MTFDLSNYEEVKDRIPQFYNDHNDGRIVTRLKSDRDNFEICRYECALFKDADDQEKCLPLATGSAFEKAGEGGMANKTSHEENCETSAIGRALANAGYSGAKRPSREEMGKVSRAEEDTVKTEHTTSKKDGSFCPICNGDMWDNRRKKETGEYAENYPDFKCKTKTCKGVR